MVEEFKKKMKENGQSLRWFYNTREEINSALSYPGFTLQLNGYAPVADFVKTEIKKYMRS